MCICYDETSRTLVANALGDRIIRFNVESGALELLSHTDPNLQLVSSLIVTFAILFGSGASHPKPRTSLLWRITKPGSTDTSYLFGTLHLLEGSYVDTIPEVMHALSGADLVVGELELDSSVKAELAGLSLMDTSLDQLMSASDYALVDSEMHRLAGLSLHFFDHFKPMTVYAMLINGLYQKAHPENHKTGLPMDLYFQRYAKQYGVRVMGLETVKDETDALFDSMSVDRQIAELLDFVKHEKKSLSELNKMLRLYSRGDIEQLMSIDATEDFSPREMEALLYQRNAAWLKKLPALLKIHHAFIAVGAGHLAGNRGLVAGLRKLGYRVTPIPLRIGLPSH